MLYGPWPQSGRLLRHFSFSSSFLRCPNPGGEGHVKDALAHRAERGLPWTWPRQDYIAPPEEEEKAPQQPAAACGCQGPATAMVPRCHGWRSGEGARARHRCPAAHSPASKRPFIRPRSAATCEGGGGTLPPRGPPAPRPGGPDLDAGALRQYIAKPSKEGGKTTEGQRQADTHVERKPRAARRVAPGTGRSGDAAYLWERQRAAEPPT